MKRKLKS